MASKSNVGAEDSLSENSVEVVTSPRIPSGVIQTFLVVRFVELENALVMGFLRGGGAFETPTPGSLSGMSQEEQDGHTPHLFLMFAQTLVLPSPKKMKLRTTLASSFLSEKYPSAIRIQWERKSLGACFKGRPLRATCTSSHDTPPPNICLDPMNDASEQKHRVF